MQNGTGIAPGCRQLFPAPCRHEMSGLLARPARFSQGTYRPGATPCRGLPLHSLMKPALGLHPVAPHRAVGHSEDLGGLRLGEPAEKPELNDAGQPFVDLAQPVERLVQSDEHVGPLISHSEPVFESDPLPLASALLRLMPAGVVDQNSAHRLCRDAEEMSPIDPFDPPLVHQPEIGFVHQVGRCKRVIGPLPGKMTVSHLPEIGVYQGEESIEGRPVAAAPGDEEPRDIVGIVAHGQEQGAVR